MLLHKEMPFCTGHCSGDRGQRQIGCGLSILERRGCNSRERHLSLQVIRRCHAGESALLSPHPLVTVAATGFEALWVLRTPGGVNQSCRTNAMFSKMSSNGNTTEQVEGRFQGIGSMVN